MIDGTTTTTTAAATTTTTVYGSLDFFRDNPCEQVAEGTFPCLLDFLVQNEDNTGSSSVPIRLK